MLTNACTSSSESNSIHAMPGLVSWHDMYVFMPAFQMALIKGAKASSMCSLRSPTSTTTDLCLLAGLFTLLSACLCLNFLPISGPGRFEMAGLAALLEPCRSRSAGLRPGVSVMPHRHHCSPLSHRKAMSGTNWTEDVKTLTTRAIDVSPVRLDLRRCPVT